MSDPNASRQLVLDLGLRVEATLANFVPGRNGPALYLLEGLAAGERGERQVHLWGGSGCGKTHLLRALGRGPGAHYLSCRDAKAADLTIDGPGLWCIDDVDSADVALQAALFNLINAVRGAPDAALVSAAAAPPLHLALREDLRTRLGWGPVYRIEPLDDIERAAALAQRASERGLLLSEDVLNYLLTHFSRDMSSLVALVDALDRYTIERQRVLTVPLLREWLQHRKSAPHVS